MRNIKRCKFYQSELYSVRYYRHLIKLWTGNTEEHTYSVSYHLSANTSFNPGILHSTVYNLSLLR